MLPNCEWNQKQKHKKQPWNKVECFAFGGATVCFASLETSFHAAKHTIPPPPSYEGYPLCPKDKNRSPFHGEKPLIIKWFLERSSHLPKRFFMVGTRYFASASNNWYSIWYYNYGRTWSITSLPGLVFAKRLFYYFHKHWCISFGRVGQVWRVGLIFGEGDKKRLDFSSRVSWVVGVDGFEPPTLCL